MPLSVVVLLGTACSPGGRPLPDVDARTVVVVSGAGPRHAVVAEYAPSAPAFALEPDEGPLYALYYRVALPWLAGTYEEGAPPWGQPLPAPEVAFVASWPDDTWSPRGSAALSPFSMPRESPAVCAQRGGCYLTRDAPICTTPCPEPPAPVLPAPPRPPDYLPCPSGWIDDAAAHACRPFVGVPPDCARGTFATPGRGCAAPGPACSGDWAEGLDDLRTTFVRVGAVGGDGTRARPLATLAEAWATGAPTVALSSGDYPFVGELSGARRVVGACVQSTTLSAVGELALDGGVVLEGLTLRAPVTRVEQATLRGLRVVGDVRAHGTLALRGVAISGLAEAVHAEPGATLSIEDSHLSGGRAALSAVASASVSVARTWLAGAVTATDTPMSLGEVVVIDVRERVHVQGGQLDLRRVLLGGATATRALRVRGAARVTARQLLVGADTGGLDLGAGSTVLLEDSRADDTAVRVHFIDAVETALTLRRVSIGEGYSMYVSVESRSRPVIIEDLETYAHATLAVDILATELDLHRVRLHGDTVVRLATRVVVGRPYAGDFSDVYATDGMFRMREAGRIRIQRMHLERMRGSALVLDNSPTTPTVEVADLTVEGTVTSPDCPSRLCVAGAAVMVEGGGLVLERFRLSDNVGPGFHVLQLNDVLDVRDGRIERQAVGVVLQVAERYLLDVLQGVRLEGIARVCDPCGLGP